ncbi:hypothetical protein [Ilyomonas limi]|nr:hypothetical protein [Ilyomonas limi]
MQNSLFENMAMSVAVQPPLHKANVGSSSLKKYVLTLSKNFMSTHPKAGQPTNFFIKVQQGEKIHTIRGNYELWQKRISEINNGKAVLCIREWSGKPYRSAQTELMQLNKVGLQKIEWTPLGWFIDGVESDVRTKKLARNDGLSLEDFAAWFKGGIVMEDKYNMEPMAIIHFTDFRY